MTADTLRDARKPGFYIIDNEVIANYGPAIGVYGLAVYNALAYFANKNGENIFPSYQTIAEMLGISRPKVISTIKLLIEVGLISKESRTKVTGDQTSNEYVLINVKGSKQHLPPLVNDINHPSKQHLPRVVNDVNHPSKQRLPDQDPMNNTQLNKTSAATDVASGDASIDWFCVPETLFPLSAEVPKVEAPVAVTEPPLSLVEQWRKFRKDLETATNKNAKLAEIYAYCFGPDDKPDFARLGALAKRVGHGLLADQMIRCVPQPPSGDKLSYLTSINKNLSKEAEANEKKAEASPVNRMKVFA